MECCFMHCVRSEFKANMAPQRRQSIHSKQRSAHEKPLHAQGLVVRGQVLNVPGLDDALVLDRHGRKAARTDRRRQGDANIVESTIGLAAVEYVGVGGGVDVDRFQQILTLGIHSD